VLILCLAFAISNGERLCNAQILLIEVFNLLLYTLIYFSDYFNYCSHETLIIQLGSAQGTSTVVYDINFQAINGVFISTLRKENPNNP